MQWSKIKNGQIHIYAMEENTGAPLQLAYCDTRLFCKNEELDVLTEGDTLYWRHGEQKGSLTFIHDTRLLRGTWINEKGTHFIKGSIDAKISLAFSGSAETKNCDLIFGSRREGEDIIDFISLREPDKEVDLGYGAVYEKEDEGVFHTHIRCSILPITDSYLGFGFLDLYFDDSYTEVNGWAWKDEDTKDKEPLYTVKGSYADNTLMLEEGDSFEKKVFQLENVEKAELRTYNQMLCVEELFSLPMPVIEDVNAAYPQALYDLMVYAISDEQWEYIGKPKRPEYSGAEKEQAEALVQDKDVKQFLTEDYYYAYLSQILANNPGMTYASYITKIKHYKEKLEGYYNKSLKTSMNAHKGYQKISEALYSQLYFKNSPLIYSYLADKKNWAGKMHDYSLCHEKTYEMLDDFSHNTQSRIQNTIQVLNYLDNGKNIKMKNKMSLPYMDAEEDYYISYGADIYYILYNRLMVLESYRFKLEDSLMTQEERKVFYEEAAKHMLENMRNKEERTESEQETIDAIEEALTKGEFSKWGEVYGWLSVFLCEAEAVIAGSEDYTFKAIKKILDAHPTAAKWAKGCAMALCQLLMLANQIMGYIDWKELSPAAKTQTILSTAYTVCDVTTPLFELYMNSVSLKVEAMPSGSSEIVAATQNIVRPTQAAGSAELSKAASGQTRFIDRLKASASEMSTVSKIGGSILTALAFAVSVCDIINDEEVYGKGAVYALDIVTSVVNGVAFLATAGFSMFGGMLMGMTAFASLLPGIGFVATIVGILLSFVTFLVKKYSKTIEEKYIEKHCVPFVEALEVPEKEDGIFDLVYDDESGIYKISIFNVSR